MQDRHPVAFKHVQHELPGMPDVRVERGIPYAEAHAEGHPRVLNVYRPPASRALLPAVMFVVGRSDIGARKILGCAVSEMAAYDDWGRLVAASGMAGLTYTTAEDPLGDTRAVLACVRNHARELGIDASRLAVWSCSANVPVALELLGGGPSGVVRATLLYGMMRDVDLPGDLPLLIVRAGLDAIEGINESIDRFIAGAIRRNLPLTFVNHATGPHAFDLEDASEATRAIVGDVLRFLMRA